MDSFIKAITNLQNIIFNGLLISFFYFNCYVDDMRKVYAYQIICSLLFKLS